MKAYEETVITLIAPRLALAAVVGSEWLAPRAARFNAENSEHYPLNRRLGGFRNRVARLEGNTKSHAPS